MYKKGLEDIETYLNEHASEHDGYRIRLDVSEIIRDEGNVPCVVITVSDKE